MILCSWQMHLPKPKPCYIVWNEPLRASASMSMHTRQNIWFNQTGDISRLNGSTLKFGDKFTYLGSSVSSTEIDINTRLAKAWTANDRLSVTWKSDPIDKIKRIFFSSSGRVDTALWMHYMYANWTYGEKAWRQLLKNAARNTEQLKRASQKAAAVRPPTTHHENYQN